MPPNAAFPARTTVSGPSVPAKGRFPARTAVRPFSEIRRVARCFLSAIFVKKGSAPEPSLKVVFPEEFPKEHRAVLSQILSMDPRPAYQDEPGRIYGFPFYGRDLRFRIDGEVLEVLGWE